MQFSSIFITSILATLAIAAPAPVPVAEAAPVVEARAQQLIDLWFDKDFLGIKFTGSANFGECKNFASDKANQFSSGKAKVDGSRCTVWVKKDCLGDGFTFNKAGSSSFPSWINDKAKSWKCVAS